MMHNNTSYITEFNDLGWFASDRYQPEGKVCIYVFIQRGGIHGRPVGDPVKGGGLARHQGLSLIHISHG